MADRQEAGTFILRSLIKDVTLGAEAGDTTTHITCVRLWDGNLYIGTSAGEVLHHVRIPPDPGNEDESPTFMLASRQKPPVNQSGSAGIQQILLLPKAGKACILSNGTLSFYTLPELSPAFPRLKPLNCGWVGAVDLDAEQNDGQDGVVVMLCYRSKIRLVKVGEEPLRVGDIEFAGCLSAVRRGNFACVADSRSYALLDIVHQQKIPLFTISSVDDQPAEKVGTYLEDPPSDPGSRNLSPADPLRNALHEERGHRKTSSLNLFRREHDNTSLESLRPAGGQRYGFDTPTSRRPSSRRVSTTDIVADTTSTSDTSKPLPPPPTESADSRPASPSPAKTIVTLKPLIASPSPQLFLLVTGTALDEPSLGIFVNLDGDVDRGTIEFSNYPEHVIVDGKGFDMTSSLPAEEFSEEGYVLAVVRRKSGPATGRDVEIQRWDVNAGESNAPKEWLNIQFPDSEGSASSENVGLMSLDTETSIAMIEIVDKLAMKPFHFGPGRSNRLQPNPKRENEETEFIRRISRVDAHMALWRGRDIFWLFRNPAVMKLDNRLHLACTCSEGPSSQFSINRRAVESIFNETRGVKPTAELDFLSYGFVRQKSALLLFIDLVIQTLSGTLVFEADRKFTEQALIESELDPRIILEMLPVTQGEIFQNDDGVWMHGGLRQILHSFLKKQNLQEQLSRRKEISEANLLTVVKRVLLFWRQKKGNPSVADGKRIFLTVDAALLHVLLLLDSRTSPGIASPGSVRAELYAVVDNGVDCFDRALELLERFKRLYVLSRLYQKRKSPSMVLSTWRRIIEGEEDAGGEFTEGEVEVRKYLSKIKDRKLVVEYGTWLAKRSPKIGVQVFADESSRVVIPTNEALLILRENAPNAVKDYLEYLVFGKMQSQHINELIAYYLDIVLAELENSPSSKGILLETYETYRALRPPKPTYRQFITDNARDAEWWHSRLRLLHLLGSNQGPASSYDVLKILNRLEPYVQELVPEMIILNGRQGRHKEALHLLTHGLGDFDTAISYCLLGGSSIFRPPSGFVSEGSLPSKDEQSILFNFLLLEFLGIEDLEDRLERTGELLERFGPWFDPAVVLSLLPNEWSLKIFATFLVTSLRRLVRDRRESAIIKALSGAQYVKANEKFIDRSLEVGPMITNSNSGTTDG